MDKKLHYYMIMLLKYMCEYFLLSKGNKKKVFKKYFFR